MRKTLLFFCLLLALGAQAQGGGHFLQNDQYRQKVMQAFDARMKLMGKDCFNVKGLGTNGVEIEALQFLYAYMPMADETDYSTDFFLANVRKSLQARQEMVWGSQVPEREFRHFVLPVRVNNENLDSFRIVYYDELKNRVKGLGMKSVE